MTFALKNKTPPDLPRRALNATEIVANLSKLEGWTLAGNAHTLAIEKTFIFSNFYETIFFVNAVAFIAHGRDHHPVLSVHFNRCGVAFNTHDVGGLSNADFECAAQVESLLAR